MTQTSTLRHTLGTAGSWLFACACVAGSIYHYDDLRAVGRWALGVPALEQANEAAAAKTQSSESPAEQPALPNGVVELRADSRGHFLTSAQVNGRTIEVLVDTGATAVALTWEDAERAGIYVRPSDFTQTSSTANGIARVAPVTIDSISIGSVTVHNVRGMVAERGKLRDTLLGMSFLGRLSRAEMSRGRLLLEE